MDIERKKLIYRLARIILGTVFLILGIAGFLFPILQGWLFVTIGAILLSRDVPFFTRLVDWISRRYPRIGRAAERIRGTLLRPLKRMTKM